MDDPSLVPTELERGRPPTKRRRRRRLNWASTKTQKKVDEQKKARRLQTLTSELGDDLQVIVEQFPVKQVSTPVTNHVGLQVPASIANSSMHKQQSPVSQVSTPVTDHVVLQVPASMATSSMHKPIGPTTNMNVENHALYQDSYLQVNVEQSPVSQVSAPVTDHIGLQVPASVATSSMHKPIRQTTNLNVGVDLQVNVEQSPLSQVSARVTDYVGLQVPASVGTSSMHKPIGLTTYMNVENHALYQDSYPRKEVNILPHQGLDRTFSKGAASDALGEESQLSTNIIDSSMYDVNSMYADTLKSIFDKHGNIVMDCRTRSPTIRTYFLETICKSVQELQSKTLSEIDHDLLDSYYLVVNDCETMKFKVKWFAERLNEIRAALDSLVEYQKIAEKMNDIEDRKRHLESLILSQIKVAENQLEDMNRSSRALECKFMQFEDNHLMHGVL